MIMIFMIYDLVIPCWGDAGLPNPPPKPGDAPGEAARAPKPPPTEPASWEKIDFVKPRYVKQHYMPYYITEISIR